MYIFFIYIYIVYSIDNIRDGPDKKLAGYPASGLAVYRLSGLRVGRIPDIRLNPDTEFDILHDSVYMNKYPP